MADRAAADRACKDPNPIIDGRKANVNLAYLGAKPRSLQTGERLSFLFKKTFQENFSRKLLVSIFSLTICLMEYTAPAPPLPQSGGQQSCALQSQPRAATPSLEACSSFSAVYSPRDTTLNCLPYPWGGKNSVTDGVGD